MNLTKKIFSMFFIVPFFFSCHNSAFNEELFRNPNDPFDDVPKADSLAAEHTVFLSWEEDDASDMFYLMRSPDKVPLSWNCIYEGCGSSFTDSNFSDSERYVYRLDKSRGQKYFSGTQYAFGWSSESIRDYCEPNDVRANATFLECDRICSLVCVRFVTDNKEFLDEDWFYVTVPPMRQADIVVGQHNLDNSTAGAKTNLRIQVSGFESQSVKHLVACPIQNTSYETKTFYFKIFPERTSLFTEGSFCTAIEYTVSLNQLIKY